jgi:hypothetical protein
MRFDIWVTKHVMYLLVPATTQVTSDGGMPCHGSARDPHRAGRCTGQFLKPKIPDRYTGQTDRYTDRRLLSGVVSKWYTGRFSYRTGPVTPKIAVYRPVYREKVNPGWWSNGVEGGDDTQSAASIGVAAETRPGWVGS